MALQRGIAALIPLVLVGSLALTIHAGPQWAPPMGAGVLAAGDSMVPTICPGDVVVYRDDTHITTGDIITFYAETSAWSVVTHRVVTVTSNGYITKGDNTSFSDYRSIGYVTNEDVIGEVFMVATLRDCREYRTSDRLTTRARIERLGTVRPDLG